MATLSVVLAQPFPRTDGAGGAQVPMSQTKALQSMTTTGTSAQSTVTTAALGNVWVLTASGGNVWVKFAANPTASAGNDWLIINGQTREFAVTVAAEKLAVIDA